MKLPAPLLGALTGSLIALNTLFWVLAFVPFILLKLLPGKGLKRFASVSLIRCADYWVAGNTRIVELTPHLHWRVIPRYRWDTHFPEAVWGSAQREADAGRMAEVSARLPAVAYALQSALADV